MILCICHMSTGVSVGQEGEGRVKATSQVTFVLLLLSHYPGVHSLDVNLGLGDSKFTPSLCCNLPALRSRT